MNCNALNILLAILLISGCQSYPDAEPIRIDSKISLDDQFGGYVYQEGADDAKEAGFLRSRRARAVRSGGKNGQLFTLNLTQPDIPRADVWADVIITDGESDYKVLGAALYPANNQQQNFFATNGLQRRQLLALCPRQGLLVYQSSNPVFQLVYKCSDSDFLDYALIKRSKSLPISALLPTPYYNWNAVQSRLRTAIQRNANLSQLKAEVQLLQKIPESPERKVVDQLLQSYKTALLKKLSTLQKTWKKSSLYDRCVSLNAVIASLSASEAFGLSEQYNDVIKKYKQFIIADSKTAQNILLSQKAYWSYLAMQCVEWQYTDNRNAKNSALRSIRIASNLHIRKHLPGLKSINYKGCNDLYANNLLGLRSPLRELNCFPKSRAEHFKHGRARLSVTTSKISGKLKPIVTDKWISHRFTKPNPRYAQWQKAVQDSYSRWQAESARARSLSNYTYQKKTTIIYVNVRNEVRTETKIDWNKKRRYEQALSNASYYQRQHNKIKANPPARRLRYKTKYLKQIQTWSGQLKQTLTAKIGTKTVNKTVTFSVPGYRTRTNGFNGSDRSSERIRAQNNWLSAKQVQQKCIKQLEQAYVQFAKTNCLNALRDSVNEDLKQTSPTLRNAETVWASYFLGLNLKTEIKKQCKIITGLSH